MTATPTPRRAPSRTDRISTALGVAGGAVGTLVGIIELSVGSSIRSWIGAKLDPERLGVVTIGLSLVALASALALRRRPELTPPARVLFGLGQLLPALIGFTTVGRLWYVPGALLLAAAVLALAGVGGHGREVMVFARRNWTAVLTTALGAVYLALGLTAGGAAGALGIIGGAATIALAALGRRVSARLAPALLALAVVPFAVATWTSVVTPLLAILIMTLGSCVLAGRRPFRTARRTETVHPAAENDRPSRNGHAAASRANFGMTSAPSASTVDSDTRSS